MSLSKFLTIAVALALLAAMVIGCGGTEPNRVVSERRLVQDFSSVGGLTFSPDGKRLAYVTSSSVVVDGIAGKQYGGVPPGSVTFSPDSKRVAYIAKQGDKWFIVVDGVADKPYDGICMGKSSREIRDPYNPWGSGPPPLFSPDSKRLAYAAKVGNKWLVVVDGIEGKQYDKTRDYSVVVRGIVFSPDSKQLAYAAKVGNKWLVVVDGKEGTQYDHVSDAVFSPDSKRVAYAAKQGDKWFVVVDGIEGKQYDVVQDIVFSPDSKRLAYVAWIGGNWFVVVDGIEGKQYDMGESRATFRESSLTFSPDNQRLAYATSGSVVVDGIEQKVKYPRNIIIFSPDSKRVAYAAFKMKFLSFDAYISWVVVDGAAGKKYDSVGTPVFSPDSKRVAYAAKQGDKWFVVVDGVEGKPYNGMFTPGYNYGGVVGRVIFDSPDSLHYLAEAQVQFGKHIYLVEERIE